LWVFSIVYCIMMNREEPSLPNIKSAIKRVKVNAKKNLRNRIVKSTVKTSVRKFEAALTQTPEAAAAQYRLTSGVIDKAASKGVIHRNAANRKKSRLAKRLQKAAAAQ